MHQLPKTRLGADSYKIKRKMPFHTQFPAVRRIVRFVGLKGFSVDPFDDLRSLLL